MPVQHTEAPPPHRYITFELNIQAFAAIAVHVVDIVIFCASTLFSDLTFWRRNYFFNFSTPCI